MHANSALLEGPRWYAVWTRSRHEDAVRRQLGGKAIEAFLPTIVKLSPWKDRTRKVEWPMFPGYCFARFEVEQKLQVTTCSGVVKIISFCGALAPVPDEAVESLKLVTANPVEVGPCPVLADGAVVEVVRGPLVGVVGRLLHQDASHATVVLSVDLIGQAVRVQVPSADVRLVTGLAQ